MEPLQIDFFHFTCISGSSGSFLGSMAHFFPLPNNIPLSGWARVYLSIPLLRDISAAPESWQLSEQQVHSLPLPPGALGSSGCRQLPSPLWPLDEGTATAEQRPPQSRASGKARPGLHGTLPAASLTEPVCPAGLSPAFPQQPTCRAQETSHTPSRSSRSASHPGPARDPQGADPCGGEGERRD